MGNSVSCQYSSSGNASSTCNTYATSDAQLTTGTIVGIVIGSVMAVILLIVLVIAILRVFSRRNSIVNANQQPYIVHAPQPQPPPYRQPTPTYKSSNPPPYPGTTSNYYEN